MPDFGISEGIALGSALVGTGLTAAQMANAGGQPKEGFNPVGSGSMPGPAPITTGGRVHTPLTQGNVQPSRYAAISDLLAGGGSYA